MRRVLRWVLTRWWRGPLIVLGGLLLIGTILYDHGCNPTGFGACTPTGGELRPEKTLWDWMDLLIVPAVLAVVGLIFTRQERANENRLADERAKAERAIAEQRAQDERAIAEQRTQDERAIAERRFQDETLRIYLDQMTELLLHEGLRATPPKPEARDVARVRTLIALRRLDEERRAIVMHFLRDSKLIGVKEEEQIITFDTADLSSADLTRIDLRQISIVKANLGRANLRGANLGGANLRGANLGGANLGGANLRGANLRGANLFEADLRGAALFGADLFGANLFGVILEEATISETQLQSTATLSRTILPDGQCSP